jgi:L-ascorbate metabolism protein UlaG (beta-lactamase superfamily)
MLPQQRAATATFAATRVANACTLLEFGRDIVLTDPWFRIDRRLFTEAPAIGAADLPRLAAIIGCHWAFDHWNIRALDAYAFKETTPVFASTPGMVKKARAAGFLRAQEAEWNTRHTISDALSIEIVVAHRFGPKRTNNYVLTMPSVRVFFGGEARDLEPLRAYRQMNAAVDVAFAPVNGVRLFGLPLVMNAGDAVEAARILGASTLIPIHYAHRSLGPLARTTSSVEDTVQKGSGNDAPRVVCLRPGHQWRYEPPTGWGAARIALG